MFNIIININIDNGCYEYLYLLMPWPAKMDCMGQGGPCGCAPHIVRPKIFFLVIFISSVIHVVWLYRLINIFRLTSF
jgi:hypothetical protein